jgi:8-oxo-dGTP diphosphatase
MKHIHVVAAVIRDGNRIFATQKGYGNYKGWWEFPGGKIEEGESPRQALEREIREELDTRIDVGELISHVEYDYPEFHMDMDCFWCTVTEGNLTLKEAQSARWLGKEDLYSVKWLPADKDILEKIERQL